MQDLVVHRGRPGGLVEMLKGVTYVDRLASVASVQPGAIVVPWHAESESLLHVRGCLRRSRLLLHQREEMVLLRAGASKGLTREDSAT